LDWLISDLDNDEKGRKGEGDEEEQEGRFKYIKECYVVALP
jgi:hypothetical protein